MSRFFIPVTITSTAILIALVHILFPQLAIDNTSLGLFVIAIIPWLSPLFKSLEFPGGLKVEYQDLEKTEKQIKKAGLLSRKSKKTTQAYEFLPEANEDPNVALAWLRVEVEKKIRELAIQKGLTNEKNLNDMLFMLYANEYLSDDEREALTDITAILNKVIHGVQVEPSAADWTVDIGPRLLKSLDDKLSN